MRLDYSYFMYDHNQLFSHTSTLIFDVDHTLYEQNNAVLTHAGKAFCKAVREHLGTLPDKIDDEFLMLYGMRGIREHGDPFGIIGAAPDADHKRLHELQHTYWKEDAIEPYPTLAKQFLGLQQNGMGLYAYSDAHQNWTHRVLNKIGLSDFFPESHILTRDQLSSFQTKRDTIEGYHKIHKRSGVPYGEMVMVDDSEANLVEAKKLGITTVLITHGKEPKRQPPAHDIQYQNVIDFLRDFNLHRKPSLFVTNAQHHKHTKNSGRSPF